MASVATSCAPCVFSASTTLLSFPYSVLQTFTVQVIPQITVRNGTSVTIGAKTTTIDEPVVANGPTGPGGPVIATFTDPSLLTWSTLGTVLTYPTTYVEYLGFDGASATSSGGIMCNPWTSSRALADSVDVTAFFDGRDSIFFGDVESTGFVNCSKYKQRDQQRDQQCIQQLNQYCNHQQLAQSRLDFDLDVNRKRYHNNPLTLDDNHFDILLHRDQHPTTTSEATSASASSANPTAQTVTHSTAHIFSTITVNPVISQSGTAATLSTTLVPPTALPVSVPSSVPVNSAALGGFLSYINSLTASTTPSASSMTTSSMTSSSMTTAAPYINGTGVSSTLVGPLTGTLSGTPYTVDNATSTTYAVLNGTSTTYVVPYTGNAAPGEAGAELIPSPSFSLLLHTNVRATNFPSTPPRLAPCTPPPTRDLDYYYHPNHTMDRSLDEIIDQRPNPREDHTNIDTDWVHDRFEDDRYDRMQRRPPIDDRYETAGRIHEATGTKLRVDNIHYDITEDDIRSLFSRKGPIASVKLLYDRQDRSQGTAFVIYEDPRDARDALADYDGQNAQGQPIRITLVPTAPAAVAAFAPARPKPGLSMFDRIQRPERSMFERIESSAIRNDSRDGAGRRRRERSDSPRRSKPIPEHIDRYVPGRGSRSPIRRRGTPREPGRRPGARREDSGRGGAGRRGGRGDGEGRPTVGGRPRKTAEELDAEMEDYWGSKPEDKSNGAAGARGQNGAAAAEDDMDMIL
ncbi:hypothetical protein B0A55_08128 [Friedmanniomyces simplex]|uniref:RRM domain-containing protein n=1 Tax=Friedmanniomyces simplex TaxID=329884 RepID=A0A4V5NG75_9PEZI|nr:hypothetical protein B0A55_08128 [Friedmanniomyces simplex]